MLLLKAALPLLAVGAAQAQGRTLVEVCTVYGVKTVALDAAASQVLADAADSDDGSHSGIAAPGGEHCALAAMVAVSAPGTGLATEALPSSSEGLPPPATAPPRTALDATALWAARLHHAPPILN